MTTSINDFRRETAAGFLAICGLEVSKSFTSRFFTLFDKRNGGDDRSFGLCHGFSRQAYEALAPLEKIHRTAGFVLSYSAIMTGFLNLGNMIILARNFNHENQMEFLEGLGMGALCGTAIGTVMSPELALRVGRLFNQIQPAAPVPAAPVKTV